MRLLLTAFVVPLVVSSSPCGGGEDAPEVPDALAAHAEHDEVTPFSEVRIEGLAIYRLTPRVVPADADSTARVVGVDAQGRVVEGAELVRRAGDRPPAELARLVREAILARPGDALVPGDPVLDSEMFRPAERAFVHAPTLEDGTLELFGIEGSMHPTLYRYRVSVPGFEVTRDRVSEVAANEACAALTGGVAVVEPQFAGGDRIVVGAQRAGASAASIGEARIESRIAIHDDGLDDLVVVLLRPGASGAPEPDCRPDGACMRAGLLACGANRWAVVLRPEYRGAINAAPTTTTLSNAVLADLTEQGVAPAPERRLRATPAGYVSAPAESAAP